MACFQINRRLSVMTGNDDVWGGKANCPVIVATQWIMYRIAMLCLIVVQLCYQLPNQTFEKFSSECNGWEERDPLIQTLPSSWYLTVHTIRDVVRWTLISTGIRQELFWVRHVREKLDCIWECQPLPGEAVQRPSPPSYLQPVRKWDQRCQMC